MRALGLGDPQELDFESDETNPWDIIFHGLQDCLEKSGLANRMGGCLHTSSAIPAFFENPMFHAFPYYQKAVQKATRKMPLEMGMHSSFSAGEHLGEGKFPQILQKDVRYAQLLGATSIVEHFPKASHHQTSELVAELCSEPILKILRSSNIILAWENLGPDCRAGSLEYLIDFRNALEDKLREIGESAIINQHLFCLDTGHLLLFRDNAEIGLQATNAEIERCMPDFARKLKVFHIHSNDGRNDQHLTPFSLEFFEYPNREGIDQEKFLTNSATVMDWMKICDAHKKIEGRHVHIEALRLPLSLNQIVEFGKRLTES
jgi:sugar phosphate isomerase/epimerase